MRRVRSSVLQSIFRLSFVVRGRGVADGAAVAPLVRGSGAPSPTVHVFDRSGLELTRGFGRSVAYGVAFAGMLIAGLSIPAAATAEVCPNAEFREQQGVEHLPGCLALEMVSPPAKDSQPARIRTRGTQGEPGTLSVSPDGNRLIFHSMAVLGGASGLLSPGAGGDLYVASRDGGQGWSTSHTNPPVGLTNSWVGFGVAIPASFSADLSRWFHVASSREQFGDGVGRAFVQGIGSSLPLSPLLVPVDRPAARDPQWFPAGSSADSSHLYFQPGFLVLHQPVFPAGYFAGDPRPSGSGAVLNTYVAQVDSGGGPSLALLARDGDGRVWGGSCGAVVGSGVYGVSNRGAISVDGSRTYFSTRPGQATNSTPGGPIAGDCDSVANTLRIMVREETPGGVEVGELVESECDRVEDLPAVPACGATGPSGALVPDGDDVFQGASIDGSKVYFTATRQLVDGDVNGLDGFFGFFSGCAGFFVGGCDLYLYDAAEPAGQRLSLVTAGSTGTVAPTVAAMSGDGSRVYFNSSEVLTADVGPGGGTAQPGQNNLYVYERNTEHPDGEVSFIADTNAGSAWAVPLMGPDLDALGVGGDGHRLVFASNAALTADDSDGGSLDVFRYDAEDDTLIRVSKAVAGGTDNGPFPVEVNLAAGAGSSNDPDFVGKGRWVSDDGETIAFKTFEGLAPEDTNGILDSYIWRHGELMRLPGTSDPQNSNLDDLSLVSVDGDTIAFQSGAQLLPQDRDFAIDVYVVRVDGGFPPPLVAPDTCDVQTDGCQGAGAGSVAADAKTGSVLDDGNVAQGQRKRLTIGISAKARRLAARRGVLALRVRSNRAGVIRLLARGGIGSRMRRVGQASERLAKPGATTVMLRLDRGARRVLSQGRTLNLAIEVRSAGARPRSIAVALRGPRS